MIEEWMECHYTDPLLSEMVVWYLRGRGRRKLLQYPGLPPSLKGLAQMQDRIGWRNFTEGKLAVHFRQIQRNFLFQEDTQLTADSWMKGLVGKLLAMTHAQWIFRCISKHHRTKGTKVLRANDDLLREIDRQLDMGVECVSEADKWMLEIDVVQLASFSLAEKQYWLHAVEAARQAGTRAMELTEGATNDWNEIIRDENFTHLPTTTPIPTEGDTGSMPTPCSPTNPTGSDHSSPSTATTPIPTEGDSGGMPASSLPINPTGSIHPSATTQGTVHSKVERP